MPIDPNNFLYSLALFMASAPAPPLEFVGSPRAMWVHRVVQGDGVEPTDPYSVLRPYPGSPLGFNPLDKFSVQCETIANQPDDALARALVLFGTLRAADGTPLQMKLIPAKKAADGTADTPANYRLVGVDLLQRPGLIGVAERDRSRAVFNFDVGVYQTA